MDRVTGLAAAMYDSYGEDADYKSWNGTPMPAWSDLGDAVRNHWIAAAKCAMCIVVEDVSGYVQELN